jgi:transcriptional antiterminator RfaH
MPVPPPSAAPCGGPWYVCVTKPRQERVAQAHLAEQGYEVWLPVLPVWKQRAGGPWQRTEEIMFPRYAFVRPGHPQQALGPVRSTPGVTSLVRFGTVLGCLADDRLQALRQLVTQREQAVPSSPLKAGDAVVFSSGPLKGLSGLVHHVAAQRVMVMMSLLGREQGVAAPVEQLALA